MSSALNIYFATVTGNAEALAGRAQDRAKKEGIPANLINLSKASPADLAKGGVSVFIVSTWGDGDAPDDAQSFWEDIDAAKAPRAEGLRYAVFGLGDRGYPEFNAFAKRLDERIAELGATRLEERFEADAEYEDDYVAWENRIFPVLAAAVKETVNA